MLAAKAGHLNVVKKLITSGARLDITDRVNFLSTIGIHCTQLHAQHVTLLCVACQLTVACVATVSSQLPILDLYLLRFGKQLKNTINLLRNLLSYRLTLHF